MKVLRLARRALRCRAVRMLFAAGLGAIAGGPVRGDVREGGRVRPRLGEEIFYSDVRLAGPEQLLQKPLEKKAEAEAAFIQGIIAEDEGAFDDALRNYTAALQLDPGGNPELTVRIAREYAKRGDVATGIDLLKDLAKARRDDVSAQLTLAGFYLNELKKPDLALRYAEEAARIAPANLASYQTLFDVYFALKRRHDAEQMLRRAEQLDSGDPDFWLTLAELAIRLYRTDNGSFPAAKIPGVTPFLQRAATLAGDNPEALARTADDYTTINQVPSAIPLYLRALELNRGNSEVRYKLAQSFLQTGQRDAAISALEEMVKSNPLKPEIYEFLGRLYEENSDRDRALANFQQALLLAPNDPENYLHAAEVQLQLRKENDAIATLTEARRRFAIPQITYALAIAFSQAKRFSDALPAFESALQEADAEGQEPFDAGFYFSYAVASEQAGLIDKAATLLKKAIALDPSKAAQAYNFLGYMWVERGQHLDEAGDMIKKALELDPQNGAYLDSLGWFYYKRGEYGKALVELLRAAELLKPADPVVLEHVGDTYQALGNPAQAINLWQKALALDTQNRGLAAKIDREKAKVSANQATLGIPGPGQGMPPAAPEPAAPSATPTATP
ncbi:MAG: tetratricopeptide repeat protein [Verrucomicrobia bacterium]|nr:tetratricopeptide repeat protein [Verrucomicrobiota bacterium]